jgi:putative phosphoribosyl transferase
MRFPDRREAGRRLAAALERYADQDPVVLALPRGGVAVGYEVARALGVPLDVLIARKLGAPMQPELGVGAVAEGGALHVDADTCYLLGIGGDELRNLAARERAVIEQRMLEYRGGRPLPPLAGRTVILVDDGVATGGTARAAIRALRSHRPERVVFAVPVASAEAAEALRDEADDLVALLLPERLSAIGAWYRDFTQLGDDDVKALLARANAPAPVEPSWSERLVIVDAGVPLEGSLIVPRGASGLVLFVHGSGSSRFSPRNRYVAEELGARGLATLLVDLLTEDEEQLDEQTAELRFDIGLLAARVARATDWLEREPATARLRVGYFGSSTGAAAALVAAAARPDVVAAVVSRGGRPDLATDALDDVRAPTLLIVGARDREVLRLNREAFLRLRGPKALELVPGATHLFDEPGALEQVAALASVWFERHLAVPEQPAHV